MHKQACGGFPGFYSEKIKKLMQELDENAMAIKDSLVDILMEERGVSEKSYEAIRMLDEEVSDYCDRIKDISKKMGNKRPSYCAEILYDELFAVQQEGEDPCGCTECKIRFDVIAKTDNNWYRVSKGNNHE